MMKTTMEREINERIDGATRELKIKIARVKDREKAAKRELWWTAENLPRSFGSFVLWLAFLWIYNTRVWWLGCRRDSLQNKLHDARERAKWEWYEDKYRREQGQRTHRQSIREAVAELRREHDGRPAMICGREPETWEEIELVANFLSGAEERHELCLQAWSRADYDSIHWEKVRERLERDSPLRRYERR